MRTVKRMKPGERNVSRGSSLQDCGRFQMDRDLEKRRLIQDCNDMAEGCALCVVLQLSTNVARSGGAGYRKARWRSAAPNAGKLVPVGLQS